MVAGCAPSPFTLSTAVNQRKVLAGIGIPLKLEPLALGEGSHAASVPASSLSGAVSEQISATRPSAPTVTTGATHVRPTRAAMLSALPPASPVQPRTFVKAATNLASARARQPPGAVSTGSPRVAARA